MKTQTVAKVRETAYKTRHINADCEWPNYVCLYDTFEARVTRYKLFSVCGRKSYHKTLLIIIKYQRCYKYVALLFVVGS